MRSAVIFPLPSCGDYLPLLAIQDGRLGEMTRQAADPDVQCDALGFLLGELYPNGCYDDIRPAA